MIYDFKIITNEKRLRKVCKTCSDIDRAVALGNQLLSFLKTTENGVGIAAPQVGLYERVCVVNVEKPIVLVNPKIVSSFQKIAFQEGCLSFPGQNIITQRYGNIAVKADNHKVPLFFNCEKNALECVCIQHEIDHLDGILMHDRKISLDDEKTVFIVKEK